METINYKELKINQRIGKGHFSETYEAEFNGESYCFKFIYENYSKEVIKNIIKLTEINFKEKFLAPIYLVITESKTIIGYISKFDPTLTHIDKIIGKDIRLLKNARKTIEELHEQHSLIHGDLSKDNILFNPRTCNSYLIDFDTSFKQGTNISDELTNKYFRIFVKEYLNKYKYDFGLDIYTFNLTTLMVLCGYQKYNEKMIEQILENKFEFIEGNEKIKKLTKELLLNDTKKRYSNEYIINYLK